MTYSFQSNSTHVDVIRNLRKGGLQIFSWFTTNVFHTKVSERTLFTSKILRCHLQLKGWRIFEVKPYECELFQRRELQTANMERKINYAFYS